MANKTIVFLINDITAIGGTERMCSLIASELANLGFDITIISHFESKNQPFFTLDDKVKRAVLFTQSKRLHHHLILPAKIYQQIKNSQPDVIVSCDTQMSLYSAIPLINKNHIVWEHFNSSIYTLFGSRWFGRRLASLCCKKIVVLTQTDKAHWIKSLHTKSSKIEVIPNPLPIQRAQASLAIKEKNIVLAVGRMTQQKGFDLLVHAWAKIDPSIRQTWQLRIVGPAGSASAQINALIQDYQLSNEIVLAPRSQDIGKEYQQASLYVLSSRYEGFGLTLIEAMGQSLPVIAFDCPMGPKEIIDNQYGELLPSGDINLLSEAICRFMQEPERREKYAKLAYQRSLDYGAENIMQMWQSTIQNI